MFKVCAHVQHRFILHHSCAVKYFLWQASQCRKNSFTMTKKVLLLHSRHGRGMSELAQNCMGSDYQVTRIFKPSAALSYVTCDLGSLGKDLGKDHHVIIVGLQITVWTIASIIQLKMILGTLLRMLFTLV